MPPNNNLKRTDIIPEFEVEPEPTAPVEQFNIFEQILLPNISCIQQIDPEFYIQGNKKFCATCVIDNLNDEEDVLKIKQRHGFIECPVLDDTCCDGCDSDLYHQRNILLCEDCRSGLEDQETGEPPYARQVILFEEKIRFSVQFLKRLLLHNNNNNNNSAASN